MRGFPQRIAPIVLAFPATRLDYTADSAFRAERPLAPGTRYSVASTLE